MRTAFRGTVEPIVASGCTVMLGLLCLLFSGLGSTRGLGPVGAVGIAGAMLATLTFLPAVLLLLGRRAFWPFVPQLGSPHPETTGLWGRVSRLVGRRVAGPGQVERVRDVVAAEDGVEPAPEAEPVPVGDKVPITAVLTDEFDSAGARESIAHLRADLDTVSPDVLVGGSTAVALDTVDQSSQDRNTIIPLILVVIFVVLALLLRALVAPMVLIVANVLSFGATLGISALVFNHVFGFPGADPAVTLIAFVFLVALGIDYSIFLMTRVREESARRGTREGVLRGLSVTGGVITNAGVVLAATFSALSVLPLLFLV